jgi:hypothetical protein
MGLVGREPLIAAAFGLVHGLAFATVLAEFGLGPWKMALCILGFNLGIELMQLAVVAATVPWLLLLSCTPVSDILTYPRIRSNRLGGKSGGG